MAANKVLILGSSGTGKSTAAENLDPKSTFIICADRKSLPFKYWKNNYKTVLKDNGKLDLSASNYYVTDNPNVIISLMNAISENKPETKVIILDTITAVMENEYMSRIKEKGFSKFEDCALDTFNLLIAPDTLREDLTVFTLAHTEENYDTDGELRTSFKVVGGKLIGQNIKPEARFTTVLYTEVLMQDEKPNYYFITQNNGSNTCKSPKGMFEDLRIPNDYQYVLDKIKDYEN
jgi:adenylate kinase family enzyme